MAPTVLAFHAHPDDEALLTGGTLARAAAQGHRALVVVATDGDLGLAASEFTADGTLGIRRMTELDASAAALGLTGVEHLGYADSGLGPVLHDDPPGRVRFCRASDEEAADRLAVILRRENVDVLLGYDANGGYGHPDHVKVHRVAALAARLAGTPILLEATIPRDTICRALDIAARFYRFPAEFDRDSFNRSYSPRSAITHRIDVIRYAGRKRAAMRAHASQASADGGAARTLDILPRIPRPLFDVVFGREWFADPTLPAGSGIRHDIFEGLQ